MLPVYEQGNPECPTCETQLKNAREFAQKATKVSEGFICANRECYRAFVSVDEVEDQLDEIE